MRDKMKLTLTDNDGIIQRIWVIGDKIEFDIEDLDATPECDFYIEHEHNNPKYMGEDILKEIERYYEELNS